MLSLFPSPFVLTEVCSQGAVWLGGPSRQEGACLRPAVHVANPSKAVWFFSCDSSSAWGGRQDVHSGRVPVGTGRQLC